MTGPSYVYQNRRWIGAGRADCVAKNGMVSSKHPMISETGVEIIRNGGNAVDAAVGAAFMNCVVEPGMNGIGGEGVMAIHLESGENVIIDYVGRPAQSCSPEMFELSEDTEPGWMGWRNVKNNENVHGHKACTTPGTVAGLSEALKLYGTMSLKEVMEPAIKAAGEGWPLGMWTTFHIMLTAETFGKYPEWRRIYTPGGKVPPIPTGYSSMNPYLLVNKELAKSLRSIADEGPEAFYKGWIAKAIAKEMEEGGGLITTEDLAMYEPIVHSPDPGRYRDYTVVYDPTHSGTTMLQTLKILEGYDLTSYGFDSPEAAHLVSEALGFAFADRFEYMGDPGYIDVPLKALVSDSYAEDVRKKIDLNKAAKIVHGDPWPHEPECTTALTVGDGDGNLVAINQTIVNAFGCGVVVKGTGIVMNNAMYGLNPEPGFANSIDGRKRRIQNVCPAVLLKDGEPFMAVGAPGGRAIQMSVSQVILNVLDHGMGIQDAISAPRIFRESQGIIVDNRYSEEVRKGLLSRGHDLTWLDNEMGNWARPVGVLLNPETGMLHGGVACDFTGFESKAIGV